METKVFTITTTEYNPNRVSTDEEVLHGDEIFEPRFILTFYVNDQVTSIVDSVRASTAYDMGIPPEALEQSPENRWHILMRPEAIQKMLQGFSEEFVLAYQTQLNGYDTERVTVKLLRG
jgi:hypothetical protein